MGRYAKASKRRSPLVRFLRDSVIIVVVAFVISFGLKTFLVRAFFIPSGSMMHTLQVNDRILVNQLVPKYKQIERGDIVVFKDPGGWVNAPITHNKNGFQKFLEQIGFAAEITDEFVVKRVIGIGGDTVSCCTDSGLLSINGIPVKEPYVVLPDETSKVSEINFEVTVPEGSLWVLGDNRYASKDSRFNQNQPGEGFVPEDDVVGRAFLINWPFNHIGPIESYPSVFAEVDAVNFVPKN